ncbi:MAG: ribonuclease HII [Limnochordales bacterium]|nr:ribonuclease HII [Limnochordales bacterium]
MKRWVETAGASTGELEELLGDPRAEVRQLGEMVLEHYEEICREEERLRNLCRRERELQSEGYRVIAGVDEAGRGPLAGPVVAAAVIFPPGVMLPGIRDSKTLTPARRKQLYDLICRKALACAVGVVSNEIIDECNILQATMLAMRQAVEALPVVPDFCLVDGNRLPELPCPGEAVVDADATCFVVACAGIVAKVYRDRLMEELDRRYPGYGLASHKGYATAAHLEAIRQLGPSPVHRISFKGVREVAEQSSLPSKRQESSV